ncbi:MAG: hypothetical protein HY652_14880, partial [Acidobacteria bacterium]|nr:hypothetical protein [Acidobacteriota bacterium]
RIQVSAATIAWGDGPRGSEGFLLTEAYRRVLQDWAGWLREGILDFAVAMNYDRETDPNQRSWFRTWAEWEKDYQHRRATVVGCGWFLNAITDSVVQMRAALQTSGLGNRPRGVCGFSYQSPSGDSGSLADWVRALTGPSEFDSQLPPLFAETASVPPLAWKEAPGLGHLLGFLQGSSVDGATLSLRGPDSRSLASDGQGWFGAVDLPPGDYVLNVEGRGASYPLEIRAGEISALALPESDSPLSLVIPSATSGTDPFTGFALLNRGSTGASVVWRYRDFSGLPLGSRTEVLAPGTQKAILGSEQFPGLPDGWMELQASSDRVSALFLQGDSRSRSLDGAGHAERGSSHLFVALPGQGFSLGSGASTALLVINPNPADVRVRLLLRDPGGELRSEAVRTLPAKGGGSGDLREWFGDGVLPGGRLEILADGELAALVTVQVEGTRFTLPAQSAARAQRTLYAAHFASGGISGIRFFTELALANLSNHAADVTLRLLDDSGNQAPARRNPATLAIPPAGSYVARGNELFGLPDPSTSSAGTIGSLEITSSRPLVGHVLFGDAVSGRFAAALPLAVPATDIVLGHVAHGVAGEILFFSGLGLLNPTAQVSTVRIVAYGPDGAEKGRTSLELAPLARVSKVLQEFPGLPASQIGGYIHIAAPQGVVSFGLFGRADLEFLAALPGQR